MDSPAPLPAIDGMSDREFAAFPYKKLEIWLPDESYLDEIAQLLARKKLTRWQHFTNVLDCPASVARIQNREFVDHGHYYSVIPDAAAREKFCNSPWDEDIRGIDLQETAQLALMPKLAKYQTDYPFPEEKTDAFRYHCLNGMYGYGDGYILHAMLRHYRPKRVIEIGSGFSSAMMLDTNERWFDNKIQLTFIEPYSTRLKSLLREEDGQVELLEMPVQEVDVTLFASLQAGDVLFIDSSHVSKLESDVNHLFFKVLPCLAPGVIIHVHDVFWPFQYPKKHAKMFRYWNEIYILRAFLMGNTSYKITWFNGFLFNKHREIYVENLPSCVKNTGANFWMTKIAW